MSAIFKKTSYVFIKNFIYIDFYQICELWGTIDLANQSVLYIVSKFFVSFSWEILLCGINETNRRIKVRIMIRSLVNIFFDSQFAIRFASYKIFNSYRRFVIRIGRIVFSIRITPNESRDSRISGIDPGGSYYSTKLSNLGS